MPPDILIISAAFISGTILGSFLNVMIFRFQTDTSIVWSRSVCRSCGKVLRWWELVPVLSYLALRGRCQRCHKTISWQYPVVEAFMGITAAVLLGRLPTLSVLPVVLAIVSIAIVAVLLVLALIDFYTFLLPDGYLLVLIFLVLLALLLTPAIDLTDRLWGLLVGSSFVGFLWLVTRGHGIGLGDVKLLFPLGALFGFGGTMSVLAMAFCAGGILGIILLSLRRATLKTPIPFGPFLCSAAIVLIFFPRIPSHVFSLLWG